MLIKVTVSNRNGEVIKEWFFESNSAADLWIYQKTKDNAFGKPERWVREDDILPMGEDRNKAIGSTESYSGSEIMKVYKFGPEYLINKVEIDSNEGENNG